MQKSTTPTQRYAELDSLRGIAALTVVFHHFRIMWTSNGPSPRWLSLANPFTAGREAVMLFFLLSGFVLSIPYLRGKGQSYPVYLLRRILRIYAPYLFALALAVMGAAIWHGPLGLGAWADLTWLNPVNPRLVLDHILMVGNYNWMQYNTAFWSLVVEMRISIIFPFLFLFIHRLTARTALLLAVATIIGATLATGLWSSTLDSITTIAYAGIFIGGIVFATNVERVNAWYRHLSRASRMLLAIASITVYTFGHHLSLFVPYPLGLDLIFITLGAAGYMIFALNAPTARAALNTTVAKFLGRISYSLYLVHGTVLFAITHALRTHLSILEQFCLYLPASLLLGYLFCLAVEEPFLRLSRRVAKRASNARQPERSAA